MQLRQIHPYRSLSFKIEQKCASKTGSTNFVVLTLRSKLHLLVFMYVMEDYNNTKPMIQLMDAENVSNLVFCQEMTAHDG